MTNPTRTSILRVDAIFLLVASAGGFRTDVLASFFHTGPASDIIAAAPHSAIGFIEAHGLAFLLGILLWRAEPLRSWHLTGAAVHCLLGTANLAFWQMFVATDLLWLGYLTTALHWLFVVLHLSAAIRYFPASASVAAGPSVFSDSISR